MTLNFKCEFCEIALKSDLDVSKHIVSQVHRDNVRKAQELHPLEPGSSRDTPKNIAKLFESLKLRTVHDVRDLADRGYFRIPPDSPATVEVVSKLNDVLAGIIAANLCSSLPEKAQKNIMDSFEARKNEPSNKRQFSHDEPAQLAASIRPMTTNISTCTTVQPHSTGSKNHQPSTSQYRSTPPLAKAPKTGGPLTPGAPKVPAKFKPQGETRSCPPVPKGGRSKQTPTPRAPAAHRTKKLSSNRSRSGGHANKSIYQVPRPNPATPRPMKPSDRNPLPNVQTSHATLQQPRQPAVPGSRPNIQQHRPTQAPRVSAPMPRPSATRQETPTISPGPPVAEKRKAAEELLQEPAQSRVSETFMPHPFVDEPTPQPRLESTYQPKLAKIKIEPVDKD